jgi:adenylylsulfate kinase
VAGVGGGVKLHPHNASVTQILRMIRVYARFPWRFHAERIDARNLDRVIHTEFVKNGGILWFTGLSGAGKSTLATTVASHLAKRGIRHELLDGDEVRTFLSAGLTFSREDRDTNVRRIGYVARLLAKHGVLVIVAAISPYAATRDELRRASEAAGHAFHEIFVHAPLATVIERDVKGLYKRAQAGEIPHFTGVSDPYEPPVKPALELRTDQLAIDACVDQILALLAE